MQGQMSLFEGYNYFNRTSQDSADGKILDLIGLYTDEYGNVKGVDGLTFVKEIDSLIASGVKYIDITINSEGGSVSDGYSIFSAIQNANQAGVKVDTYVRGAAASMAGIIAMAGRKKYIMDYGFFMLHNPSIDSENLSEKDKEILNIIKTSLTNIFIGKTGIDAATIENMMNEETWMSPDIAVSKGFFDEVIASGLKIAANGNVISNYRYICNQLIIDKKIKNEMEDKNKVEEVKQINAMTEELNLIKSELEKIKNEKEELEKRLAEKEAAEIEANKQAATEFVENSIKEGILPEETKEESLSLAISNLASFKNIVNSMPKKNVAHKLPKLGIENKATKAEPTVDFHDLDMNNPKEFKRLMEEEPEKFQQMKNEWLEQERKNKKKK